MKRAIQPNVRKVYGGPSAQQESQMNAVRKIHNLLSSGAVTVTGPTQPRILKQKMGITTNVTSTTSPGTIQNSQTQIVQQAPSPQSRCYVCDEVVGNQCTLLSESVTTHSNTKLPNKIGQLIGEAFMVIISLEDVICKRCVMMINHLDRLELDFERVKSSLLNFIFKKYGLSDEDRQAITSPPAKLQKLNSGNTARKLIDDEQEIGTRKIVQSVQRDPADSQLSNMFEGNDKQPQTKVISQQQTTTQNQQTPARKGPIKIYKCMSCEFKTTDLKQFQPHYEICRQQNGFRCKICKKIFVNMTTLKQHVAEKHPNEYTCNICNTNFLNEITLKKHMELNHPENKSPSGMVAGEQILHSCNMCQYKTTDKASYDDHLRKHVKLKPFKCRICSVRFETREQASIHAKSHQPNYYKCGTCSASFTQREMLVKHFETHQKQQAPQQPQQQQQPQQGHQVEPRMLSTQKLLQDTIDEALRESETLDSKGIHFFSCNICSLTFIQENYYNQHMEMHKREGKKGATVVTTTPTTSQSLIRQDMRNSNLLTTTAQGSNISETDIESIFEKMHSDKAENEASNSNSSENLVITSQENSVGGITFNITIPRQENASERPVAKTGNQNQADQPATSTASGESVSVGIDMPVLDQGPEDSNQRNADQKLQLASAEGAQPEQVATGPVSMPSLDDEGDSQSQPSNTDQVPMDLEDMQNAVEGNQIKFILNENGQILQLDNHIITTDADGNQILVQGTDSEQIQQLLQSVGVLQTADGLDGELQMIGDNNQMIIVQQGDNEAQLIDASLLNADGHIVIQQSQDGDIPEGAHAIGEDGVRIPVSVAYTTNEQGETVAIHAQSEQPEQENSELINQQAKNEESQEKPNEPTEESTRLAIPVTSEQQIVATTQSLPTSTGEAFFALEDLMQQSEQKASE